MSNNLGFRKMLLRSNDDSKEVREAIDQANKRGNSFLLISIRLLCQFIVVVLPCAGIMVLVEADLASNILLHGSWIIVSLIAITNY